MVADIFAFLLAGAGTRTSPGTCPVLAFHTYRTRNAFTAAPIIFFEPYTPAHHRGLLFAGRAISRTIQISPIAALALTFATVTIVIRVITGLSRRTAALGTGARPLAVLTVLSRCITAGTPHIFIR